MSSDLDQAIYALLTPIRAVTNHHANDGGRICRKCGTCWPCFEMDTAIAALGLVLRVHVAARRARAAPGSTRDGQAGHSSRDLRAAVGSRRLTDSEAAALTEIIEMLDLAVAQADDAGMSLPLLAGIEVAVVDGYRSVALPAPVTDDDTRPTR